MPDAYDSPGLPPAQPPIVASSASSLLEEDLLEGPFSRAPRKNLGVISLTFFLTFLAYFGVQNLASSLDKPLPSGAPSEFQKNNVSATLAFGLIWGCSVISNICAPLVVDHIGAKLSIACGVASYLLYVIAFVFPRPWTLYPAAVLLGCGAGLTWVGQGSYCTWLAKSDAHYRRKPMAATNGLIQGVFWMCQRSTQLVGNLLSSVVQRDFNATTLFAIYSGSIALALVLTVALLEPMPLGTQSKATSLRKSFKMTLNVFRKPKILRLWPMLLLIGAEQALSYDVITADFVQPVVGTENLGFVMAFYGAGNAIGAMCFGRLGDIVGKRPILLLSCALFASLGVLGACSRSEETDDGGLVRWPLNSWWTLVPYVAGFGVGDGMTSVIFAALGCPQVLHRDEIPAGMANAQLWPAIVLSAVFFAPSSSELVRPKLILLGVLACVASSGLFVSRELAEVDAATIAYAREHNQACPDISPPGLQT